MSTIRILVTPRSVTRNGHPQLQRLRERGWEVLFCKPGVQPSEDDLLALLPGCVGYLAGVEKISVRVLEAAKGLQVISRNGVGVDNVDLSAAERLGVKVMPAIGANSRGVAELTIGLILSLTRSIPFSDASLKRIEWQRREGIELEGKTLGFIGCGRIGREVAKMAAGLGMKTVVYDVVQDPASGLRYAPMGEVVAGSDVLSLHCPAPADGQPLVDAVMIGKMKRGAYLVNTARYGLLDPAAVIAGLDSGWLAGLALDVFDVEPPVDNPLVKHPRVIATPHIGGYTAESVERAMAGAVDNLLMVLREG
ncbi:MAG: phosphoglycerate dehydrogenase [Kiritimatiellia bacterium]